MALVLLQKEKLFARLCFALLGLEFGPPFIGWLLYCLVAQCFLRFVCISIAWCFPTPTLLSQADKLLHD